VEIFPLRADLFHGTDGRTDRGTMKN